MHTHTHMMTCTYTHTVTHTHIHNDTHLQTQTHTHTHKHTHIHAHTHTHLETSYMLCITSYLQGHDTLVPRGVQEGQQGKTDHGHHSSSGMQLSENNALGLNFMMTSISSCSSSSSSCPSSQPLFSAWAAAASMLTCLLVDQQYQCYSPVPYFLHPPLPLNSPKSASQPCTYCIQCILITHIVIFSSWRLTWHWKISNGVRS